MKVSSHTASELARRSNLPTGSRPLAERERALEHLLESYEGSVTRTLEDYQYLTRVPHPGDLEQAAQNLTSFSRALDSREGGRMALAEFEKTQAADPELFSETLEESRNLERGMQWWQKAQAAQVTPEQRRQALELAGRAGDRADQLLDALLQDPPSEKGVSLLTQLLDQIDTPGVKPDSDWRVEDEKWVLKAETGYSFELESEGVDLTGLSDARLRFQAEHKAGQGRLEFSGKPAGKYSSDTTKVDLRDGLYEFPLGGGSRLDIELDVRPKDSKTVTSFSVHDLEVVGKRTAEHARPEWNGRGDWGQATGDRFSTVWSDSPFGKYQDNCSDAITSEFVDLGDCSSPQVAFELRHEFHWSDKCHFEARSEDGEWQTIETYDGDKEWHQAQFALTDFEGQKVQFRFRMQTDGNHAEDGFDFSNFRVLKTGDEEVSLKLHGHPDDKDHRHELIEAYLKLPAAERDSALEAWTKLARGTQDISTPLEFWKARSPELDAAPQLEAFLKLRDQHGDDAGELLARLNQNPEQLELGTELMCRISPKDYDATLKYLEERETPLKFYVDLLDHGDAASAEQAIDSLRLPWGQEGPEQRREWLTRLNGRMFNNEAATSSLKVLKRWLPAQETPDQAIDAFLALYTVMEGDAAQAQRTWSQLQDWQMKGEFEDRTLSDCAQQLIQGLMVAPREVDRLLRELREGKSDLDIDIEDDFVIIGDTYVERKPQ